MARVTMTSTRFGRGVVFALALALTSVPFSVVAHDGSHEPTAANAVVLGQLSFPTSTHSEQAQAAFVQGMLWLHLFEYDHAVEEFRKAERLDPDFAMAYWGEAMTYTHPVWNQEDRQAALSALAKLAATPEARAAKAPTAREKGYLAAVETLYGAGTVDDRDRAYLQAMAALAKAYPKDDEAQLFHALALLGLTRGVRDIPNYLKAAAIAQRVFAHNPKHPGAAHYWIHGMDDPQHAAGALMAARALSKIAPGAGHAQHMTSHIFMALGLWQDVVEANINAIRVIEDEAKAAQRPFVRCGHYPSWLLYSYYQLGQQQAAQNALTACLDSTQAAMAWYQAHPEQAGDATAQAGRKARMDGGMVTMRAIAVIESEHDRQHNAAIALDSSDLGRMAGWDDFARGYAAAKAGDFAQANAFLTALQAFVQQAPAADDSPTDTDYLKIMALMLQASIAQGRGEFDQALIVARDAATRYDALPFDFGPPVPVKPPRELLGELLLAQGKAADAQVAFQAALKMAPKRALSMQGLARAQAAGGNKGR